MLEHLNKTLDYMATKVNDKSPFSFTSTEYAKLERVVRWIEHNRYKDKELELNRRDFVSFIREHDTRRGSNFDTAFPELGYFLEHAKRK